MTIHREGANSFGNECLRRGDRSIWWIWDGLVADQAVTLLSAPEKTGKTTLLSLLLDRRREGGQLLGRAVQPGRTMLCSEEESILWALRQPPLDFGPRLEFHSPFGSNPTRGTWRRFIDHLLGIQGEEPYTLLVIDTVMSFLPAAQNNPRRLRWALEELRVVACGLPAGVLLLHQASAARSGHRARGPLRAFADILIDMDTPPGDRFTRRRQFYGVGRYPGTFQYASAELNPEGTDYLLLADGRPEASLAPSLETLLQVLRQSPSPLTRQEILDRWPHGEPPPSANALWRVLARGCEQGRFVRSGEGTKAEAFRYALAAGRAGT